MKHLENMNFLQVQLIKHMQEVKDFRKYFKLNNRSF